MIKNTLYILFCLIVLQSCFKEKPITTPVYSDAPIVAALGSNYAKQMYFDIETRTFVDSSNRFDYDLAFSCDPNSYLVYLNSANLMQCIKTGKSDFDNVTHLDTIGKDWKAELGHGLPDSNAIGLWYFSTPNNSRNEVFILNMGIDGNDHSLGYKKIQINNYNNGYVITYANLDNSDKHTVTVYKINGKNKVFLSFKNNGEVKDLEPLQSTWDLLFTSYSTRFYVEKLNYRVTGVLTNPFRSKAYFMDSVTKFDSINLTNVNNNEWNDRQDNIGFAWKNYEYNEYTVNSAKNYIIQANGKYYKMHFFDFYNEKGEKGYPKFLIEELK